MLSTNALDFNNYKALLKGNYRKGVHAFRAILENPIQREDFASNLGGVGVIFGVPIGHDDRNSQQLLELLRTSNVMDKAALTWLSQWFGDDAADWDTLTADADRAKQLAENELFWRAAGGAPVGCAKVLAKLAGLNPMSVRDIAELVDDARAMEKIVVSPAALAAVVRSKTAISAVAASESAMAAIVESETAMAAVAASETAMTAVLASEVAMTAMLASEVAMTAVAISEIAMTAVAASEMAMAAVAASETAMAVVSNTSVALSLVSSSPAAMAAIAASELARNAIYDSETAFSYFLSRSNRYTGLNRDFLSICDTPCIVLACSVTNLGYALYLTTCLDGDKMQRLVKGSKIFKFFSDLSASCEEKNSPYSVDYFKLPQ